MPEFYTICMDFIDFFSFRNTVDFHGVFSQISDFIFMQFKETQIPVQDLFAFVRLLRYNLVYTDGPRIFPYLFEPILFQCQPRKI